MFAVAAAAAAGVSLICAVDAAAAMTGSIISFVSFDFFCYTVTVLAVISLRVFVRFLYSYTRRFLTCYFL